MNLVASLLIFSFFGFEVLGVVPISLTDPAGAIGGFAATVRTLVVPGRRHDLMTTARVESAEMYDIPPAMIARMGGQTVERRAVRADRRLDISAAEVGSVAGDPGLRRCTRAAWTSSTPASSTRRRRRASSCGSRRRSRSTGASRRSTCPRTQLAIQCNYRQVSANASWQLLERSHYRCGAPERMSTVSARFGEEVHVPAAAPGQMVVAVV